MDELLTCAKAFENLCCLENLSENFSPICVRTLDRGFDVNAYYRYFLKRKERFVIRAKKNRKLSLFEYFKIADCGT